MVAPVEVLMIIPNLGSTKPLNDSAWTTTQRRFEETERRLRAFPPAEPMPSAKLCRESAHRTLGHLTACQAAWLPLMRQIKDGASQGAIPINPDPLFRKLGFSQLDWQVLLDRFVSERSEWRALLSQVDLEWQIMTPRRVHSAQTLTKRMVDHEKRHLDQIAWSD